MSMPSSFAPLALLSCALAACNGQSGQVDDFGGFGVLEVPARRGSAVVLGCTLDAGQRTALESSAVKKLVTDVILVCFDIDGNGDAQPSSAESRTAFAAEAAWVGGLGYHAKVGVSLGGDSFVSGKSVTAALSSGTLRAKTVSSLIDIAGYGDGLELDLQNLPDAARDDVTMIVTEIASVVRPGGTLGVFVPASAPDPSGLRPVGSVDVIAVAAHVDRVRVMTLGYPGPQDRPAIDSGWAVDAARLVLGEAGKTAVDISLPLDEAANATVLTLAAWPTSVLSAGVGVVFYDLGTEDPTVWTAIVEATP